MKEKFTADEWGLVKTLPFQVWALVAGADGNVDRDELKFLDQDLKSGAIAYKDPLLRELAADFFTSSDTADGVITAAVDAWKSEDTVGEIKALLDEKLTQDERERFFGSLFILGRDTARASGGSKGGIFKSATDPISDEEKNALFLFTMRYGIDLQASLKHLS